MSIFVETTTPDLTQLIGALTHFHADHYQGEACATGGGRWRRR